MPNISEEERKRINAEVDDALDELPQPFRGIAKLGHFFGRRIAARIRRRRAKRRARRAQKNNPRALEDDARD